MRVAWLLLAVVMSGCQEAPEQEQTITLATTTSTRDSGLLDVLVPEFEDETGIEVKVVAVGSGQAIEMGRRGDADVLLTHAPEAEERFVLEDYGNERRLVMHNNFVLVGPRSDPANVSAEKAVAAAFARIAQTEAAFVSRGDESGTHMKEKSIWKRSGTEPEGTWYASVGSGMAQTLRVASEKGAYTLSDWGTFLSQRKRLDLHVLSGGDPLLCNQYAVIVVNSAKHAHVKTELAERFADYLMAPETQAMIRNFGLTEYGEPLFYPGSTEAAGSGGTP